MVRFPELILPIPEDPTPDEIDAGLWCPPGFEPNEAGITVLAPGRPISRQFARLTPECTWLESDNQTIVAVSSPHIPDPEHLFYSDLRILLARFAVETAGRPRAVLKEGRLWPEDQLQGDDARIISDCGDGPFLQVLARRYGVPCSSVEPERDKEMMAVIRARPELQAAVRLYTNMRMLPLFYQGQQSLPGHLGLPVVRHFRSFVAERRATLGSASAGSHLYSVDKPGALDGVAMHLALRHNLPVTWMAVGTAPTNEIKEQVFRCTNSPVFQPMEEDGAQLELCDVQKVAVLVNRLRERRAAYLRADLGRRAINYLWMSGPLHYEVALAGLRKIADERSLRWRPAAKDFGLHAVRTTSW